MRSSSDNTVDRSSLGFSTAVRELFSFLEREWGFECVREDVTFVRYETTTLLVNVYHGRISFEVGVEVGTQSPKRSFSLEALVTLYDAQASREYWACPGRTPESVRRAVSKGADGLSLYGGSALSGEPSVFERLERLGAERRAAMVLESRARGVRPEAAAAFKRGDYGEAARLYSSIEEALSPVEIKKMELARRRAADS